MKSYLIKNFSIPGDPENTGSKSALVWIGNTRDLLQYLDEHKGEKISVYECECVVDWS